MGDYGWKGWTWGPIADKKDELAAEVKLASLGAATAFDAAVDTAAESYQYTCK